MKIRHWLSSLRPKTLPLAMASIFVGNALAYSHGHFSFSILLFTLLTAILLQILSNLANDYGDAKQGADQDRIGPLRGIQCGAISIHALKKALWVTVLLSLFSGLTLLFITCHSWFEFLVFIALGALSILAAITYTVGTKPYGYIGLGDLSVLIFFGGVAVIGSDYLQTKTFSFSLCLPALAVGLLATGVLNMNNMRDYSSDKKHNKRTLIVIMGQKWGCYYHLGLIATAYCALVIYTCFYFKSNMPLIFLFATPIALKHLYTVFKAKQDSDFIPQLVNMVKLNLLTIALFCIGLLWG